MCCLSTSEQAKEKTKPFYVVGMAPPGHLTQPQWPPPVHLSYSFFMARIDFAQRKGSIVYRVPAFLSRRMIWVPPPLPPPQASVAPPGGPKS
jgi:hypothetical protein